MMKCSLARPFLLTQAIQDKLDLCTRQTVAVQSMPGNLQAGFELWLYQLAATGTFKHGNILVPLHPGYHVELGIDGARVLGGQFDVNKTRDGADQKFGFIELGVR